MKRVTGCLKIVALVVPTLILVVIGVLAIAARRSAIPDNINMGSDMSGMDMANNPNMIMPSSTNASATPISQLVAAAPAANTPVKSFTLTTQMASIDLGGGKTENAYTYNGQVPGTELRVEQGDMVVVTLINKLPVSTTIHWHGIAVPNSEDGVAGLTQDAVKPGESYTYRFMANDVGTYWYHSHQDTSIQLPQGLFGALIVEPKTPAIRYDRDYSVMLHEWDMQPHSFTGCHAVCPETLTINDRLDQIAFAAKPGENVRLRLVNSGNETHLPVLVGASYQVVALDGHDLQAPTPLAALQLPVGPAPRLDLAFTMPATGQVTLIDADPRAAPEQHPLVIVGDTGTASTTVSYPSTAPLFDFGTYGRPSQAGLTLSSHFDAEYTLQLGERPGFYDGNFTLIFPINGQIYPSVPTINVKMGDVVKLHLENNGSFGFEHTMHLHGHVMVVLAHNGKALTGSPVYLDTLLLEHGESYDVAFVANNPGLWMFHCHMVEHDMHGMDMMINYPNISTPYRIGPSSGNNPF